MGSDKSFDTLLNKYNILLAQTRDLKEQLKNSQEKNQQLLSKFDVVERMFGNYAKIYLPKILKK